MGSYLQKPVVQKESYEGTGQEFGLHELDFSYFSEMRLTKDPHTNPSVIGLIDFGAWIPNVENNDHLNPKRDIIGDQQQCKDGEQIWKIHIFIRFEDLNLNDVIKVFRAIWVI